MGLIVIWMLPHIYTTWAPYQDGGEVGRHALSLTLLKMMAEPQACQDGGKPHGCYLCQSEPGRKTPFFITDLKSNLFIWTFTAF